MKTLRMLVVVVGSAFCAGCAATDNERPLTEVQSRPDASALLGNWVVDLRPVPGAESYLQELTIESVEGGELVGSFYSTPISAGKVNIDWGTVHLAFITSDGSGPYSHAARVVGDVLHGTTFSPGRNFLSVWTATRK